MAVVEIKNPAERNKLIVAILLGILALVALYFAFGRNLFSSGTTASSKGMPTPRPSVTPNKDNFTLPTNEEQNFNDVTTEIVYIPGNSYAPDAGRNIFAFYEPPPPTPYSPTPIPPAKPIPTPTPTPVPEFLAGNPNPQMVYAGSRAFRLEINGDRFTPDARIYFNQTEMPTTYVNAQKLFTDIPANLIAQEGGRQVIVQTPDGKKYSNQVILNVQAPPKPQLSYIGMIGRKRFNNDTAIFIETGKTAPFSARLNDIVGGRFRLVNIMPTEAVFEDVSLGFRHRVEISKQTASSGQPTNNGFPPNGGLPGNPNIQPDCVPGIPCNIPPFVPPQARPQPGKTPDKKDVDDNDDGSGGG